MFRRNILVGGNKTILAGVSRNLLAVGNMPWDTDSVILRPCVTFSLLFILHIWIWRCDLSASCSCHHICLVPCLPNMTQWREWGYNKLEKKTMDITSLASLCHCFKVLNLYRSSDSPSNSPLLKSLWGNPCLVSTSPLTS